MVDPKHKSKASLQDEAGEPFLKAIGDLADVVVEGLSESHYSDLESFNVYARQVRSIIYADPSAFRHRFVRGYQMLLDEIAKGNNFNN